MKTILHIILALAVLLPVSLSAAELPWLEDLNVGRNENLRKIRRDIATGLHVVKGCGAAEDLPELNFYRYRVKSGDTFWKILSRTSMDMDTLMSVNSLGSPGEVKAGRILYIPTMRGILVPGNDRERLNMVLKTERIDIRYVRRANRSEDLDRPYIFIPCGRLPRLDRSLFLGTAFTSPLNGGCLTSRFGMRRDPFGGRHYDFHGGIDLSCPLKTAIRSSRRGRVVYTGFSGGYGNLVIVEHERGYRTYYGHLSRILAATGDQVDTGQIIALSGNTGHTTGPHLHFEIRRNERQVNPASFLP